MNQLPMGWIQGQLGQFFVTTTGSTPPKSKKNYYGEDIPFVKPPQLLNEFISEATDNLSNEGAAVARVLPPNSILVSCIGNLGKVGLSIVPVAFNQQINAITPDEKVIPVFMFYQALSPDFNEQLHSLASGTTVPIVNKSKFNSINIVLPPIPEQKRIVTILDEAFAGITQAVANAEKNLANARQLFESYLNNVLNQKNDTWKDTILEDEIEIVTGFAFKSKGYTVVSDGIKLLRGDNIIQDAFRWDNVKRWPKSHVDTYPQYFLEEHDVVIAMDRTWVKAGLKYAQVSPDDLPCLLVQRVARLRVKEDLDSNFLKYLIGSNGFTRYVLSIQTGIGVPHISGPQIKKFRFLKPSLSTQKHLSIKLDELHKTTQRLETIYQQKLAALAELKQSILQKAFTGELTRRS